MASVRAKIAAAVTVSSLIALGATTASAQAPDVDLAVPGAEPTELAKPKDDGKGGGGGNGILPDPPKPTDPRKPEIKLRLKGLKGGKLKAGESFTAAGTFRPYAKGEKVTLLLKRGKQTIRRKTMFVRDKKGASYGKFKISDEIVRPGRYRVQAIHKESGRLAEAKNRTRVFKIDYPDLDPGNHSSTVKTFNRLLERQGYVNDEGSSYDSATERAVLAFHKVNGQKRTGNMRPGDFKKLAKGGGGYDLKYPGSGKHVEADLSRQVMVLAKGDKVKEIYHISSGAPATPTILGHFKFYRKEPGTNNVGMVNSVYFIRGYATHGYPSVPTYPASHGCLRNPIPDSKHIYNWIDIGDSIHVYR
jgi:lipoprotein-anchoring transpeptidase ErfK/SrfK